MFASRDHHRSRVLDILIFSITLKKTLQKMHKHCLLNKLSSINYLILIILQYNQNIKINHNFKTNQKGKKL